MHHLRWVARPLIASLVVGGTVAAVSEWSTQTWLVAGGRDRTAGQPLNVAPVFASNFYLPDDRVYSRSEGTPTTDALEALLGRLDGGRALAFASGMAAAAVVFHRLAVGSQIAVPTDPYHGVAGIVAEGERQGRWSVRRLDQADTEAWVDAVAECDLVWLESPENPLITVADLPTICRTPRPHTTIVAVDSTFATPINQQPLALGADVVMHSATKFIGGHSDLLAGVLTVSRDDLFDEFHERRLLHGASIGAIETFLTIRGVRTLGLRLERAQANAMELATRLESHPEIARVRYPGLVSHPTHEVAARFMSGFGAMVSFETTGAGERATEVCERAQLINHATSLGGVESTMERRSTIPGQERIPPTLIRFSVGCEDVEDLWADLAQALDATSTRRRNDR